MLARALEARAEMPFTAYLDEAVLRPLGLGARLRARPHRGSSARCATCSPSRRELLAPTLVARETLDEATSVAFPGLVGVLPGFGRQEPNDWGLGFELRDQKSPHWTGSRNSPPPSGTSARRHFPLGRPGRRLALACLTDREFGGWAREAWPALADAVLEGL